MNLEATTLKPLAIRRLLSRDTWGTPAPFGPAGWRFQHREKNSVVIVSEADFDGSTWIHASISHQDVMPSYDELTVLHQAVFPDGFAFQVFAPPTEHVNIHPFALHLWGRADGKSPLPHFGQFGSI